MTLALVSASQGQFKPVDAAMLDRLQRHQFTHDENNHREIARLTVQRRITHMTLHFAKYAGYLAQNADDNEISQILTDILIIGLSCANILNLRLSEKLDIEAINNAELKADMLKTLTVQTGSMAAACEKLDHLEKYSFRETLENSVLIILSEIISVFASKDIDVEEVITLRLEKVKAKQFLSHNNG